MVVQIKQTSYYVDKFQTYRSESLFSAVLKGIDRMMGDVKFTNYVGAIVGASSLLTPLFMVVF